MNKFVMVALVLMAPFVAHASDLPAKSTPAAPAPVSNTSNFDAFLGGAGGYHSMECTGCSGLEGMAIGLRGSFEAPISNRFGFQGDVALDSVAFPAGTLNISPANWTTKTAALHAFWRDPSVGLLGIVGQSSMYSVSDGALGEDFTSYFNFEYLGVEGQYFMRNVTLYGQVAGVRLKIDEALCGDCDVNGVAAAAQLRYFLTDDVKVTLRSGYLYNSGNGGSSALTTIGLAAETRLSNMPMSLFADVSYQSISGTGGCDGCITETKALVGLNYALSGMTLLDRDRKGASLDPFESLLAFY